MELRYNRCEMDSKASRFLIKKLGRERAVFLMFVIIVALAIYVYYYLVETFRFPILILYYFAVTSLGLISKATIVYSTIRAVLYLLLLLPSICVVCDLVERALRGQRDVDLILILRRTMLQAVFIAVFIALIIVAELMLPIYLLSPVRSKANHFIEAVKDNPNMNAVRAVQEVVEYVNEVLSSSWNRPESALEIDNMLSETDYLILRLLGFDVAHVIFFQKWGSCGQYAVATSYLLDKLGFEARMAKFKDIDHTWAEVQINGTWYIVDPWYIGLFYRNHLLVPASELARLFKGEHEVVALYFNRTEVNASADHGYK